MKRPLKRCNIKSTSLVISVLLLLYLVFSSGYHKYEIDGVIKNSRPEDVWNYVADFSKMRLLNPTILNFRILSDSGHTHDWRYTVEYTERLSHWPYWANTARANYIVVKSLPQVKPVVYSIKSKHETCFFKGLYCLHAESEFNFAAQSNNTYCSEKIHYECPPFLSSACKRELEYQRKAVMHNLTIIFSKKY
ncbi:uncharacterized protein LOC119610700 [Lucilia sericata]|uniref:uncharacterized protein LOC119610700 n=1 Tax=Lucilia sericata TaxID=13632 RepID=UPI0018A85963|nr:uncharacterized protein LOC119610700 [Lucilia sericata]